MRIQRNVVASVVIAVTVWITTGVGTALAAAPANDLFANATVMSSLPFSQTLDTTQATVDSTDAQVATACDFPGLPLSASVWYAFTPSTDQIVTVDFSGSNYPAVLGVVSGAPGNFRPVQCTSTGGTFVALAGQTYYLDVPSFGASGGTLNISVTSQPAPAFLDQSFTSPNDLSGAINDCCAYVGQTFTAGRTGLLSGVNIDVIAEHTSLPLHVAIRAVDSSGLPSSTVLGDTLTSSSAPLTQLITFPQPIHVTAGTQYAIIVNYQGAPPAGNPLGIWAGGTGDPYPRGSAVYSFDNGVSWFSYSSQGFDNHFQTYVEPVPTSKDQCKNGGWRNFTQFKNQGQCVAFVEHAALSTCLAERAQTGRAAFRAKYGEGRRRRHALRRCLLLHGG